jgi:hypothetical protein
VIDTILNLEKTLPKQKKIMLWKNIKYKKCPPTIRVYSRFIKIASTTRNPVFHGANSGSQVIPNTIFLILFQKN